MTTTLYLNAGLYLIAIIGVILLLAWLVRKFGLGAITPNASEQKRIKVVASVGIDGKRRLAIVKCDAKEYLILVGGSNDVLIDVLSSDDIHKTKENIFAESLERNKTLAGNTKNKGKAQKNEL